MTSPDDPEGGDPRDGDPEDANRQDEQEDELNLAYLPPPRNSFVTGLLRQCGRAHSKRTGACEPGARSPSSARPPQIKMGPMRGKRRSCAR